MYKKATFAKQEKFFRQKILSKDLMPYIAQNKTNSVYDVNALVMAQVFQNKSDDITSAFEQKQYLAY